MAVPDDPALPDASAGEGDIQRERSEHVRHRETSSLPSPGEGAPGEGADAAPGEERETTEPRTFTVVRRADESGVSGTGRVLDGCVFHNGQVVICWRGDINSEKSGYASLAIYPCWEAFHTVHIGAHPQNETEVIFGHGADLMARLIDQAAESVPDDAGQNDEEDGPGEDVA